MSMLRCAGIVSAVALLGLCDAGPVSAVATSGPDTANAASVGRIRLALNPQPEPPNKNKQMKAPKSGDVGPSKMPQTVPPPGPPKK